MGSATSLDNLLDRGVQFEMGFGWKLRSQMQFARFKQELATEQCCLHPANFQSKIRFINKQGKQKRKIHALKSSVNKLGSGQRSSPINGGSVPGMKISHTQSSAYLL